jgi:hypothetical protein
MKRLLMALTLTIMIAPVFAQAAAAAPYKHEDACMYPGYPCSEWTRDNRW